jgi:hypothetical protein
MEGCAMEALDLTKLFGYGFWFSQTRDIELHAFQAPHVDAIQLTLYERVEGTVLSETRYITGWFPRQQLLRVIVEAIQDMERELTVKYKEHKRRATPHVR